MPAPEPPRDLRISDATDDDRMWVATLMASSDPWRTLGRDFSTCLDVVAETTDTELFIASSARGAHGALEPLGFVLLRARGLAGSPYIVAIGVAPEARGSGVGAALIGFVEQRVSPPARHLFLCVSSFNADAQRFYARLGFAQVGNLPDYIVDGASELILHKRLDP